MKRILLISLSPARSFCACHIFRFMINYYTRGSLLIAFLILSFHLFGAQKLSYTYSLNGNKMQWDVMSWFAMPGDTLYIQFSGTNDGKFFAKYTAGDLMEDSQLSWRYVVPEKTGLYPMTILHGGTDEKLMLNIFVKMPASRQKGEYINGYRIGNYPVKPYKNNPKYLPPDGFIEITQENQDTRITPHLQLKQFLCKQQPGQWPKYLLLDTRLLIKLEMIIDILEQRGLAKGMFIMSGYRTPYYNASIGQGKYSRHIYGDAADIYVDDNLDGEIDDLNRDGKASMGDADVIYNIVEKIEKDPANKQLVGGMGKYRKTSTHTWDVHVDTRGFRARW